MGITISLLNQKGGVGKSSSVHHLAGTLAKDGHRVLVLDNDPQSSLTQGFFGPDATRQIGRAASVAALYDPTFAPIPDAMIRATGFDRLSIVPGSKTLTPYNMLPVDRWQESEAGIRDFLTEIRGDFDITMIDCPPNLHLCSWAALVASDFIIVPLSPEDYGAQGIVDVQDSVAAVQNGPNPGLQLLGYLLTMTDKRLGIHSAYETLLREMYGDLVFSNHFPLMKDYKEAVASRLPISHHKPKSTAGKAAKAVADELLERVARMPLDVRRVA